MKCAEPWLDGSVGLSVILYTKRFDSQSKHIPRPQVQSLVRVCVEGYQLMSFSHTAVSLPPPLSKNSNKSIS